MEKGVAAVTAVNLAHPALRAHRVPPGASAGTGEGAGAGAGAGAGRPYAPPLVREMFCVTAAVADVLVPLK